LLAGATGYIGRAVAAELVRRKHRVVALVRKPGTDIPGCEVRVAEVTEAAGLAEALRESAFDVVVSCIASRSGVADDAWRVDCQANRHLLAAARERGTTHFVLLSAICVQRPRLAFQHAKLAFEAELQESGLDYSIVRPTAFFKSISGQIERVKQGKPFLVFGEGTETACKPIGEADLAAYIADCFEDPAKRNAVLPIGGPGEAVTPREQGTLLFELTGMPPRFRSVPPGMFNVATAILAPLGKLWPAAAKKAELARIGHYYATESMLVWDPLRATYDADATPSTGSETLRHFYARVLQTGLDDHDLGEHKVF
jgi:divinyl chlorophyllide a 8-vinyl-reductase